VEGFQGAHLGRGCQKNGCRGLELLEEAIQVLKLEFSILSPKISRVSLMGVNLMGSQIWKFLNRENLG
jgi:hypothetical protein